MEFNQEIFDRYVARGFCAGQGEPDGQVCVEVAIALACGEEPTDSPSCVHPGIRRHAIRLNDSPRWESPESRAEGMRTYAMAQLGTREIDHVQFARRLAFLTVTRLLPPLLLSLGLSGAEPCERATTLSEARSAAANAYAAAAYADAAAYAAAYAAAAAANAAAAYAAAAANAAAYAAAYAADAADAKQKPEWYLRLSAELAIEAIEFARSGQVQS